MTERFTDPIPTRALDAVPTHALPLLHQLGVGKASHEVQSDAVATWLETHADLPPLLVRSLEQRGLPTRTPRAA